MYVIYGFNLKNSAFFIPDMTNILLWHKLLKSPYNSRTESIGCRCVLEFHIQRTVIGELHLSTEVTSEGGIFLDIPQIL